jgi:NTP-dependent ternary system trypsin peptidase co-occuring protein
VAGLVRIGLEDGGWLVAESAEEDGAGGPVKAGRVADAFQEMPGNLRSVLGSVAQASREVLAELRDAGPDEVKIEFGVKLTVSAGAVLTKGEAACHLKVTVGWSGGGGE